jgi:carbamoyltransferase
VSGLGAGLAVSLFDEDRLRFALEEDKLRRTKGIGIVPGTDGSRAVREGLAFLGAGPENVDRVVYTPRAGTLSGEVSGESAFLAAELERFHSIDAPVTVVDHVEAQMAFAASAAPDADRVLMVGRGSAAEGPAGTGFQVEEIAAFDVVSRVEELVEFLGLNVGQIHHLENLAGRGDPALTGAVEETIQSDPAGRLVPGLAHRIGMPPLRRGAPVDGGYPDVAASIHAVLVRRVGDRVEASAGGWKHLALSGGVFHSWRLNDALAERFGEGRFTVSFAPGNAGCAIGGPMALDPGARARRPEPFLGPSYSRDQVKAILDNCKARYEFHSMAGVTARVSDALADGRMVGWFSGRCEFGLRALGARSVLTNPANPYACDNLSSFLKRRPAYMSYAVVMPAVSAPLESPYMSRSIRMPDYFGDHPVRLQTVTKQTSPLLDGLLAQSRAQLGTPALLNTSLNYFDEPIACAPRDAIKTFYASGLDMLVMENFVLSKI